MYVEVDEEKKSPLPILLSTKPYLNFTIFILRKIINRIWGQILNSINNL